MKPRTVIILLALVALAAKIYCAATTLGTNDTVAFFVFGKELSEHRLAEMYRTPIFNHTPLVAAYLSTIYDLAPHSDQTFALLLRLPGIFADFFVVLALLWLREKGPRVPWWALGLFALSPVSFMVSGFHGNVDSVMVLFLVLAACAVVAGQPGLCGLACAFACHVKAAPLLLLPVFAAHWWARRRLWPFAGSAAAMIVFGWIEPLLTVPQLFAKNVLSYGGYWGLWGVTYWLRATGASQFAELGFLHPSTAQIWVVTALKAIVIGGTLAVAWWRRRAAPADFFATLALCWLVFFVFAPGFGPQYLVWLAPFALVLSPRGYAALTAGSTALLFVFYTALCKGLPWRLGISTRDNTAQWTAWTNLPWLVLVAWLAATFVARLRENAAPAPALLDPPVEAT